MHGFWQWIWCMNMNFTIVHSCLFLLLKHVLICNRTAAWLNAFFIFCRGYYRVFRRIYCSQFLYFVELWEMACNLSPKRQVRSGYSPDKRIMSGTNFRWYVCHWKLLVAPLNLAFLFFWIVYIIWKLAYKERIAHYQKFVY